MSTNSTPSCLLLSSLERIRRHRSRNSFANYAGNIKSCWYNFHKAYITYTQHACLHAIQRGGAPFPRALSAGIRQRGGRTVDFGHVASSDAEMLSLTFLRVVPRISVAISRWPFLGRGEISLRMSFMRDEVGYWWTHRTGETFIAHRSPCHTVSQSVSRPDRPYTANI